ncbi:MAG: hypothetical protein WAT36_11740 [Chromatiaceae bacterium]
MKKGLSRLVSAILILAALYLIGVNLALNLPATQDYLNSLRPDRLAIGWERAWSWYPLRVEFRGFAADGQTPTEQWQVDAERAAASVSLRPLLKGELRVHDLDLVDIDLRPRSGPAQDAAALKPHFPSRLSATATPRPSWSRPQRRKAATCCWKSPISMSKGIMPSGCPMCAAASAWIPGPGALA